VVIRVPARRGKAYVFILVGERGTLLLSSVDEGGYGRGGGYITGYCNGGLVLAVATVRIDVDDNCCDCTSSGAAAAAAAATTTSDVVGVVVAGMDDT